MHAVAAILLAAGLLALTAAVFDWDVFFGENRANPLLSALGRTFTRILYGALGAGLATAGFLALTGTVDLTTG
jgi:hypothetical protein